MSMFVDRLMDFVQGTEFLSNHSFLGVLREGDGVSHSSIAHFCAQEQTSVFSYLAMSKVQCRILMQPMQISERIMAECIPRKSLRTALISL